MREVSHPSTSVIYGAIVGIALAALSGLFINTSTAIAAIKGFAGFGFVGFILLVIGYPLLQRKITFVGAASFAFGVLMFVLAATLKACFA